MGPTHLPTHPSAFLLPCLSLGPAIICKECCQTGHLLASLVLVAQCHTSYPWFHATCLSPIPFSTTILLCPTAPLTSQLCPVMGPLQTVSVDHIHSTTVAQLHGWVWTVGDPSGAVQGAESRGQLPMSIASASSLVTSHMMPLTSSLPFYVPYCSSPVLSGSGITLGLDIEASHSSLLKPGYK